MNTKDWIKKPENYFEAYVEEYEDRFHRMLPIYNFHILNSRSSSIAWHETAKVFQTSVQDLMDYAYSVLMSSCFFEGDDFVKHCQEMEKILDYKSIQDGHGKFMSFTFYVALEFNLPIPVRKSWVENNLFDFKVFKVFQSVSVPHKVALLFWTQNQFNHFCK